MSTKSLLRNLSFVLLALCSMTCGCNGEQLSSLQTRQEGGESGADTSGKSKTTLNQTAIALLEGKTFQLMGHLKTYGGSPSIYACLSYSSKPGMCTIYYGRSVSGRQTPLGNVSGASCRIFEHPARLEDSYVLTCTRRDGRSCDPDMYFDKIEAQGLPKMPPNTLMAFEAPVMSGQFVANSTGKTYVKIVESCEE